MTHNYIIEGRIGGGGMGDVHRARDPVMGRLVAIKSIQPRLRSEKVIVERFMREAQAMAKIDHPNVVKVYHYFLDPVDGPKMVMEYIHGVPLQEEIWKGPMREERAVNIIKQLLLALEAIHAVGIIHRDIKPANIMLAQGDNVKLIDFGIAKDPALYTITSVDTTPGSLAYVSPEVLRSMPVSPATDVYSVGITLYELLTGQRPFSFDNNAAFVDAQLYRSLPNLPDSVSRYLQVVVARATNKNPTDRFTSAKAMWEALSSTTQKSEPGVTKDSRSQVSSSAKRTKSPINFRIILLACLGIATLFGTVAFWVADLNRNSASVTKESSTRLGKQPQTKVIIEPIPYQTQSIQSTLLPKGRRFKSKPGTHGEREKTIDITAELADSKESVVSIRITKYPTDEVWLIGTNLKIACSKGHRDDWDSNFCYACGERLPPGNDAQFPSIYDPTRSKELEAYFARTIKG